MCVHAICVNKSFLSYEYLCCLECKRQGNNLQDSAETFGCSWVKTLISVRDQTCTLILKYVVYTDVFHIWIPHEHLLL